MHKKRARMISRGGVGLADRFHLSSASTAPCMQYQLFLTTVFSRQVYIQKSEAKAGLEQKINVYTTPHPAPAIGGEL